VREKWRVNSVGSYCAQHKTQHKIDIEYATLPGDARGDNRLVCGSAEQLEMAGRYYVRHKDDRYSPGIHMPKWACRLWLEITGVRVERVQDISEEDARAEGSEWLPIHPGNGTNYIRSFADLWDSINVKRGYGFDVNPLVWVVEFKKARKG